MMDTLLFQKLENGNYAAPGTRMEITLEDMLYSIKDYNGRRNGRSMFFKEGGDVYLTDSPTIHLQES